MGDNAFAGISFGYDNEKVMNYRKDNMCSKWESCYKNFEPLSVTLMKNTEGDYIVSGKLQNSLLKYATQTNVFVKYWASNSPNYRTSYAGSGLPFPNEEVAFQESDNVGMVKLNGQSFIIKLHYPNSYYTDMGTKIVQPQVKLRLVDSKNKALSEIYKINLGNSIPFRSLSWNPERDWNIGPMFYNNPNLPIRTQEQILRDSAYPSTNVQPKNFWGLAPSH